jgi:Raf kinase inhibitor-like YbhB/YbcL family protein
MGMDRNRFIGVVVTFLTASAMMNHAVAQQPGEHTFTPRVIALAPPKPGEPPISVSSPDFAGQNYKDRRFFQIECCGGQDLSPGVAWSTGPVGTQSYVLIMEGEGGLRVDPTIHWIIYNIPTNVTLLPRGIPTDPHVKDPAGALNGLQDAATGLEDVTAEPGYRGPNFHASSGTPHPYYFEVFALDTKLSLDPAQARRGAVVAAMQGHVLASGELVTRFGAHNFDPPQ